MAKFCFRIFEEFVCRLSYAGFDLFEEGYEYFLKARKIMNDAGFELRKWETNLVELKDKIYEGIKEIASEVCVEKKVLGLAWDISKDTINFCFEHLVEEAFDLQMTNRSNLSISARIYEPLGLLSNINCSDETVISNYLSR